MPVSAKSIDIPEYKLTETKVNVVKPADVSVDMPTMIRIKESNPYIAVPKEINSIDFTSHASGFDFEEEAKQIFGKIKMPETNMESTNKAIEKIEKLLGV